MWTDNTGNAKIKGDQIEVFKIVNGYENIDSNIFFKLRKVKELEDITTRLLRNKVDWMLENTHFPRGPSMHGINYQLIVYMLVVLYVQEQNRQVSS